jgi:hypothetical protein
MLGILVAWGGLKSLVAAMPPNLIPAQSVIELNAPVLTFTLCVAVGVRADNVAESLQDSKNSEASIGIKLRLHGYSYFDSELSCFDCVCRRSGVNHARFCHDPVWNGGHLTDPNGLCGDGDQCGYDEER